MSAEERMYDASPLLEHLNRKHIVYKVDRHPRAVTALETAEAEHVSGKLFAKSVVVKDGKRMILAVLPANLKIDLEKLARVCGCESLELASEEEFAGRFPDCEVGAMPPFGKLYGLDVYLDDDIASAPEVTFNACSHEHTITISGEDFVKATEGVVKDFNL